MSRFIGIVSAYAYAVSQGYTGTEEEYAELMASYATVAEEAAESAESASQSAESASASASTATTKASEASQSATQAGTKASQASTSATQASASATSASQSAQTATTKASEASASATQAGTKASEASTSATTASTKASEASASATSAQTAQGLAESARDDAIDAKTDAETARDLAQQYAESIDPENIFSAYPTDTASGAVASFTDGADDIPMKSVKVAIEPVQSGSGDPSPDNIRPISGWTGAQVVRCGKNLFDTESVTQGYIIDSSGNVGGDSTSLASDWIPVVPEKTYYISPSLSSGNWGAWYDINKNYISGITGYGANSPKVAPSNAAYMRFTVSHYNNNPDYATTTIVEMNAYTGIWSPYTGDTYPITFPSEAGTVYGGTLDVTNGTLTVDRAFIASYNGETLPSEWISDRDKYVAGTTPTTGAQVCYKLSQAVVYTLTPTEIKSLLGDNNVWADAGDTAVTYRADTAKYIDKKIAEVINALS